MRTAAPDIRRALVRLDRWLLVRHPELWALRIHYALAALPVALLVAVALAWLYPVGEIPPTLIVHGYVVIGLSVVSVVAWWLWMAGHHPHTPTRVGTQGWTGPLGAAAPLLCIVLVAWLHVAAVHFRVHRTIGDLERNREMLSTVVFPLMVEGRRLCNEYRCPSLPLFGDPPPDSVMYHRAPTHTIEAWIRALARYTPSGEEELRRQTDALGRLYTTFLDSAALPIATARADSLGLVGPERTAMVDSVALRVWNEQGVPRLRAVLGTEESLDVRAGLVGAMNGYYLSLTHGDRALREALGVAEAGIFNFEIEAPATARFWALAALIGLYIGLTYDAVRSTISAGSLSPWAAPTAFGVAAFAGATVAVAEYVPTPWPEWEPSWSHSTGLHLALDTELLPLFLPYGALAALTAVAWALPGHRRIRQALVGTTVVLTPWVLILLWPSLTFAHGGGYPFGGGGDLPSWSLTGVIVCGHVLSLPLLRRMMNDLLSEPSLS